MGVSGLTDELSAITDSGRMSPASAGDDPMETDSATSEGPASMSDDSLSTGASIGDFALAMDIDTIEVPITAPRGEPGRPVARVPLADITNRFGAHREAWANVVDDEVYVLPQEPQAEPAPEMILTGQQVG